MRSPTPMLSAILPPSAVLTRMLAVPILAAASLVAQEPTEAIPQPPRMVDRPVPYDPFDGMDFSGRIPRPDLPEDLGRPERWRYTPPARIKPGSVFDRFLVSSFISPIIFREEDIGFGGGFALTDIDFLGDNFRQFANIVATYSEEGQQTFRINWSKWLNHRSMANGGIIREERGRLYGRGGFSKTLTRRFFGLGSRTSELDETSYTQELSDVGFGIRMPLPDAGSDWLARFDVNLQHNGLSGGRVSTVPSTNDVFGDAFADGDGIDQAWVTGRIGYDTRDSLSQAYEGGRIGASIATAYQTAGEWGAIVSVDGQHVFATPPLFHDGARGREENPPTDVLAFGFFAQDTVGDLPFYSLPTLGGERTLRGYIQNRFTDRAAAHFSAEYRVNLFVRGYAFTDTIRIERVGLAVFYDLGTVASDFDRLDDARLLSSYGVGMRFGFSREAVFRVDLGFGDEGSNLTIAFGNSF
ncbi:MAG: BamA/TamA family outer membrane protein [Planctomycetota bacterium]